MKIHGQGTVRVVYGEKGLFCDSGCAECFKVDRDHGLIYCAYKDVDTNKVYNPGEASIHFEHCCYCTRHLGDEDEKT